MQEKQSNGFCIKRKGFSAAALLLVPILSFQASNSLALEAELGDDVMLAVDTTLSYNSAWRVQDANSALNTNGNANFDKGDQTLSSFKFLADVDLSWKQKYGVFLRGRGLYDTVYTDDDKFLPKAQDRFGEYAEFLDAYAYANVAPADLPISLRVGRQTIFWGESLLIFGSVATAQNPLDTTMANAPAVEARELLLPTGQVYGQITTANSKVTLASYYKWEWESSILDENTTYFSTNNALDEAGKFLSGVIPRGIDKDAEDGGEYGVAVRYLADSGDEYGVYYLNYNENMPLLNINNYGTASMNYNLEYQEDVHLAAATYSTVWGETNIGVEVSYRANLKVGVASPLPAYEEAEFLQAQVSVIHSFGEIPYLADSSSLFAEWGYNNVLDFDKEELAAEKWATGGKFKFVLNYFNVLSGLDMDVPISVAWNPAGKTSYAISGFNENANSVGINFDFTYLGVYKFGVGYVNFLGDAEDNNKTDRDFVSLNLKYTF